MKILRFLLYSVLAWGPLIIVISSLISIFLILPFTFIPSGEISQIGNISLRFFLAEVMTLILMIIYCFRVYLRTKNIMAVAMYCFFILASSVLIFFYRPCRLLILFQPVLPIVYAITFEKRLDKIRNFLNTSKKMLGILNFFDIIYIFSFIYIIQLKNIAEWLQWVILIIFFVLCPMVRTVLLRFYPKQNKDGNTYFSSYISMFVVSFFQLFAYAAMFLNYLELKEKSIINLVSVYIIFTTISIYFWYIIKTQLDRGGIKKRDELLRWTLGILAVLFIFFYDRIEGEFLVILSWLLPVLISTIVGELHYQFVTNKYKKVPIPTVKMKQHVYWLQLISFLTLFSLNLFSALFTVQKIKGGEIISVNTVKVRLINFINPSNKELASEWMSSFTTSFIIVSLSFILAMVLSTGGVKLLKLNYLDSSKGYYKFQNSIPSILINRKYKRNIHKRRKNNV